MSGAVSFDPFAAAGGVPVAPPTNDNVTSTPTPAAPQVSQELIPNYDANGNWSGYTRAADTPGIAPTPDAAPQVVAPPPAAKTTPASPSLDQSGITAPTQETSTSAPSVPKAKSAEFDPFAAAGGVPVAATEKTTPSSVDRQELRNQPWYQGLWDAARSVDKAIHGGADVATHAATFGLDEIVSPIPAAIAKSLSTGQPFTKSYDEVIAKQRSERHQFEAENPATSVAIGLAAGVPAAAATAPLFGVAAPGAGILARGGNLVRNIGAGAAVGGAAGFGETDGDVPARLEGASQGAQFGGALSAAAPVIAGAVRRVGTALRPAASVDNIAGNVLRESAGLAPGQPVPSPDAPAIPGMPIGSGGAFNNAGIAARERNINAIDDAGRQTQIEQQNAAIRDAATTQQPGGTQLARAVEVPEASASVVTAMQRAREVLRTEEERLWTKPELANMAPNAAAVKISVDRAINALPERYKQAINGSPDLRATLDNLASLPQGSTLADFNSIRSDILSVSRSLPFSERFAKKVADTAADAVLTGIETNPSMRNDPAAMTAYQRARDFTRNMWSALDKPQFQRMLQATDGNRKGLDPGTLAGQMFKFGQGTERTPQGVAAVADMLDGVRRQWGALATGNAGVALPGLSPSAAFSARAELTQGTRDFIVNSMLNSATSNVRDQAGNQRLLMNKLSDWIDTNRPWIDKSRLFNQQQIGILDKIREASIQAQRVENLRGGTNSATFEYLAGDRYVDAFIGPFLGRTMARGGGALAGLVATHLLGEAGIGGMIGMELAGAGGGHLMGTTLLQRIYAAPREALMARMTEAVRDPVIAEDLMKKAGQSVRPETQRWFRSLLAVEPASALASSEGAPT